MQHFDGARLSPNSVRNAVWRALNEPVCQYLRTRNPRCSTVYIDNSLGPLAKDSPCIYIYIYVCVCVCVCVCACVGVCVCVFKGAHRKSVLYRGDRRLLIPTFQPAALSIYQTELRRSHAKAFKIQVLLGVKPRHCASRCRRFESAYCLASQGSSGPRTFYFTLL